MARRPGIVESGPVMVGVTNADLFTPDDSWSELHNVYPTEAGGYISINKPMPILTNRSDGATPSDTTGAPTPGIHPNDVVYGAVYGVFHARLKGGDREVLLAIVNKQLWELRGWRRGWVALAGPASISPIFETNFEEPAASDFNPQWVATPTGVVIVPPSGRAMFYDGEKIGYLGYDSAPSPPVGLGPESSSSNWFPDTASPVNGINDSGYAMDGLVEGTVSLLQHPSSYMHPVFRNGRVGTVDTPGGISTLATGDGPVMSMGYLLDGEWRCRVQHIDHWGNVSPASLPSNSVKVSKQPSKYPGWDGAASKYEGVWLSPEKARKQIAWTGISAGQDGTIGRILYRTKDLVNSGTTTYWELPRNATEGAGAYATIPDNVSQIYPDNIPDTWLTNELEEIQPVPEFRLATMAFGRLWMTNSPGDEGAVWWSLVGRWGTIGHRNKMYPDTTASEVTGLRAVNRGLLIFTRTSTYLVTQNERGDGFRSEPISTTIGCVAPASIATMRNGVTVWLGDDGFYAYDGNQISFLFNQHRDWAKRFNRGRMHRAAACVDPWSGEYRCWVSYENSGGNSRCFVYDSTSWRTRDDITASGVCITDDHRRLSIASGQVDGTWGVWVLDRAGAVASARLKTGWQRSERSHQKGTVYRIQVLVRETGVSDSNSVKVQVKARVNWRSEVVETGHATTYPKQDTDYRDGMLPGYWGTTLLGANEAIWRIRRPFWVSVDMYIGPCDVFQLEFSGDNQFEILGYTYQEADRNSMGAQQHR